MVYVNILLCTRFSRRTSQRISISSILVCHADKNTSRRCRLRDRLSRPGGLGRCQTGFAVYLGDTEVVIALPRQCHSIIPTLMHSMHRCFFIGRTYRVSKNLYAK